MLFPIVCLLRARRRATVILTAAPCITKGTSALSIPTWSLLGKMIS
jgi:hypothetical protein